MKKFLPLEQAIADNLHDGDTVAFEGFTHLIPHAAAHEAIRQRRRNLTLIRMTPDIIYDQMIGMNCAKKLIFSFAGNPGVGLLHRLRDAVENAWPQQLEIEEYSHSAMANAWEAGASGLSCAIFRGSQDTDLNKINSNIKSIKCPFTEEKLTAVPALRPDVGIIHAHRANKRGDIMIEGIIGVQKEVVLASKKVVVTVEEVVDEFKEPHPNLCILPAWTVTAVSHVPGGAHPSYTHGLYKRDNLFYQQWNEIAVSRESFMNWMEVNVLNKDASVFVERVKLLN